MNCVKQCSFFGSLPTFHGDIFFSLLISALHDQLFQWFPIGIQGGGYTSEKKLAMPWKYAEWRQKNSTECQRLINEQRKKFSFHNLPAILFASLIRGDRNGRTHRFVQLPAHASTTHIKCILCVFRSVRPFDPCGVNHRNSYLSRI